MLEEQLFESKVGGDERRREVFQTVLHLDRDIGGEERQQTAGYVTSNKQPLCDNLNSASFHTDSWEHDKENRHLSEARSNLLSRAWPAHRNQTSKSKESLLYWETVEMMRCVLDVGTHLSRFPAPLSPHSAIFIAAKDDLYVPRKHITDVRSAWPGQQCIHAWVISSNSSFYKSGYHNYDNLLRKALKCQTLGYAVCPPSPQKKTEMIAQCHIFMLVSEQRMPTITMGRRHFCL